MSSAGARELCHYVSLLSQGAMLADSPKLGLTFDFLIYRLIQVHAHSLLNLPRTAEVYASGPVGKMGEERSAGNVGQPRVRGAAGWGKGGGKAPLLEAQASSRRQRGAGPWKVTGISTGGAGVGKASGERPPRHMGVKTGLFAKRSCGGKSQGSGWKA